MRFRDRRDAGQHLAARLAAANLPNPLVLALPRGGVPVAAEVARVLGAPLEVFVSRKVGAPHHPEFGIGAVAEGGGRVADWAIVHRLGLTEADFDALAHQEELEVQRRAARYRAGRALPDLHAHAVVVVDDGLATGVTAEAALRALRRLGPGQLVLAVPVCATATVERLADAADEVICVFRPDAFHAVGRWYEVFDQITDEEVDQCLAGSERLIEYR